MHAITSEPDAVPFIALFTECCFTPLGVAIILQAERRVQVRQMHPRMYHWRYCGCLYNLCWEGNNGKLQRKKTIVTPLIVCL